MSHKAQREFLIDIKNKMPMFFKNVRVLDIGSLDINGNNRFLFDNYEYIGIDLGLGKNVDIVCKGHEYKDDRLFDVVISTEAFEHDPYYKETIKNAIDLLKVNGMLIFTCASTGRLIHGTKSRLPNDSPLSINEFGDYYKNLTEQDIRSIVNIESMFSQFEFRYEGKHCDLYFWGIKNGNS